MEVLFTCAIHRDDDSTNATKRDYSDSKTDGEIQLSSPGDAVDVKPLECRIGARYAQGCQLQTPTKREQEPEQQSLSLEQIPSRGRQLGVRTGDAAMFEGYSRWTLQWPSHQRSPASLSALRGRAGCPESHPMGAFRRETRLLAGLPNHEGSRDESKSGELHEDGAEHTAAAVLALEEEASLKSAEVLREALV
jgi:hypothetical protein